MVTCRPLPFSVFQALVAAKIRGYQGTEAHFFNATTCAAQRTPAETRFDDLGGRQGGAQVGRLFESQLHGRGPKVFYPLPP
jgi:hypothetical protein